jgi:type IX secretion system PorP/SprF family membrane protein
MYLSVGVMGGITQRQFNPAKLTFDNQYNNGSFDPSSPNGENFSKIGFTYPDVATGLSFSTAMGPYINWFIGAAYYHFNSPKVSFYNDESIELKPKWEYNAGVSAQLSDFTKVIFQYNQLRQGTYGEIVAGGLIGQAIQIQKGADANTRMIYGGIFYRINDAVIPVIKLELQKYEVGFSYDFNISKLSKASQSFGGYEISISYKGFFNSAGSSLHSLRCPRF